MTPHYKTYAARKTWASTAFDTPREAILACLECLLYGPYGVPVSHDDRYHDAADALQVIRAHARDALIADPDAWHEQTLLELDDDALTELVEEIHLDITK